MVKNLVAFSYSYNHSIIHETFDLCKLFFNFSSNGIDCDWHCRTNLNLQVFSKFPRRYQFQFGKVNWAPFSNVKQNWDKIQYCSTGDLWLCGFGNVTFAGVKGLHHKVFNSLCHTSCNNSCNSSCYNSCNNSSSRSSTNNNDNDNNKHRDGKYHFEHIRRAGLSGWARGHGGGGVHHGQALGPPRVGRHHHCPLYFRRDRWLGQVTLTTFR